MTSLHQRLQQDAFAGYAYAYPHKTSYRPLNQPVPLQQAWQTEQKDNLFLYVHLPFCEMRCGFCNLFTTIQPPEQLVRETLEGISRQSEVVASAVQPERISQIAFGGGTPSFLELKELHQLFGHLTSVWPIDWDSIPVSFEVSPATVDEAKLEYLKSAGVDRLSMGIQSFTEGDLKQLGRPQSPAEVERAIDLIQNTNFPVFNIDLIYGSAQQTVEDWETSVRRTIEVNPEEIYLYPLYVRELTGLGRTGRSAGEHRRELFLVARDLLLDASYEACSMRLFRHRDVTRATDHCCQDDGMIGLGPGARSYTQSLHYSSEYAVGQTGVKRIIHSFNQRDASDFSVADFGVSLNVEEQKRRYLIKSLLRSEGMIVDAYEQRFGTNVVDDFPQLSQLCEFGFCDSLTIDLLRLNADGISWSDVIGPWLYSESVTAAMEACELV